MAGVTVGGDFVAFDSRVVDLQFRGLRYDELLPLLESFKQGKFLTLEMNLVFSSVTNTAAAGSDSCAADWQQYRRPGRRVDRRGAEGQQQPAEAPSCKACYFHLCFALLCCC